MFKTIWASILTFLGYTSGKSAQKAEDHTQKLEQELRVEKAVHQVDLQPNNDRATIDSLREGKF